MNSRPIVMYLGGFAKVGGIEAFARDFLLAIAEAYPARELVIWGSRGSDHRLLGDIAESGAKISGTFWRWGCLWNLPDFVLAPIGARSVQKAGAVIFKRPPPSPILRFLRHASQKEGRQIPFILVTPYRPAEYWPDSPSLRDLENFDIIVVQSEAGAGDLQRARYQGRIETIPYLPPSVTDLAEYPSSRSNGVVRLGYLGRLAAQKNLGYLLDIFKALQDSPQGIRYELHLYGDGAEREELERRSADLGLKDIAFHGESPRSEVSRAIDSCDLFLITSTTEGQCLVALEVLARGRPIAATPVGALPEVLRENKLGRLAPLDDPATFAKTVAEMGKEIVKRKVTPKSVAAVFRQRFDRETVLNRYLDLLSDCAREAHRP